MRPVSKKRRSRSRVEQEIRAAVFARDGHQCRLAEIGDCFGRLTPHHRRKASAGGAYVADNLVTLCAFHNGMVEDEPSWFVDDGPFAGLELVAREGDPGWESLGRRANRPW